MNVSVPTIDKIRDSANRQKRNLFEKQGWKMNYYLTAGDIRLVLEVLEQMEIDLHFK